MSTDKGIRSSDLEGWTAENEDVLDILATDLAENYLDSSLSLEDSTKPGLRSGVFTQEMLSSSKEYAKNPLLPSRNILVLGSGASAAAFGESHFPLVSHAIKRVERVLATEGASPEFVERRLDEESERVATFYGFEGARKDFETQLGILSGIFSPEAVADALSGLYSIKYAPHMIFELIAHMLKHRFIDAVINFNFDELLDVAVNEEIGESHFHNIISDGHCQPLSEIMIRGRLKIPLYIKPHGTVSHKSTMRFTKDQYFRLPTAMYTFMRDIVAGHHREEADRHEGYRPYRTNIISVGFGMGSLDLLGMLKQAVKDEGAEQNDFAIFHLNVGGWGNTEKAEQMREGTGVARQYFVDVDQFGGIEGALRTLWRKAECCFSKLYRPRGIARHEVIHQIFHKASAPGNSGFRVPARSDAAYFFARVCTEVVLALAKGNGRLDLSHAVSDRVGTYFDRLSRSNQLQFSAPSLLSVMDRLGGKAYLRWTGSAQNILTVRDAHLWNSPGEASEMLATSLWSRLSRCLRSIGDPDLEARIREIESWGYDDPRHPVVGLRLLVDSDAQDIKPRFSHNHFLLFRRPDVDQVLHTNLSVTINFVKMVTEVEWDLMLTISENGKILQKFKDHRDANPDNPHVSGTKYFCVIVAETDHQQITHDRITKAELKLLGGSSGKPFYTLPVSQHNHHMTLLLKHVPEAEEKWEPVRAIYYEKLGMGNRVSPVLLDEAQQQDLKVLVTTFFAYVNKAEAADGTKKTAPLQGEERARQQGADTASDGVDEDLPRSERLLEEAKKTRSDMLATWSDDLFGGAGT